MSTNVVDALMPFIVRRVAGSVHFMRVIVWKLNCIYGN